MERAIITNIQKYSVHDGKGIRSTIFFKGCPLKCLWCHNPETQSFEKEITYNSNKCLKCYKCKEVCPRNSITIKDEYIFTDMKTCSLCEKCMDFCINSAREIVGREYTTKELITEIEKDKVFYEESGGGVTLSGGEAMLYIDFIEEFVTLCYERGISVIVDTCGYVPYDNFIRIKDKIQMFLYDLKIINQEKHIKYTGKDNSLILENLGKLSKDGAKINLRLPLIEGINTDDENIKATISIAKELNIDRINLLPYHDIGKGKYAMLNMIYHEELMKVPSEDILSKIKTEFEKNNFNVEIGG